MKKVFLFTAIAISFIAPSFAQNIGIGTTTPKASFNVAAGQTVLFGTDTTSGENKLMWLPVKGAFRIGNFQNNNDTIGLFSTAMDYRAVANGYASTAMGYYSFANGFASTALGSGSANGDYSTAMGYFTTARSVNELVIGTYNDYGNTNRLFEIGDGNGQANSNALTVLNNGMVGIGTTNPNALLEIDYASTTPQLLLNQLSIDPSARLTFQNTLGQSWAFAVSRNSNSANDAINFYDYQVGGNRFTFFGNGNATFSGTLTQNSDERLKINIHSINNVLPVLNSINAYTYNWKEKNRGNDEQIGFLAQEIEKVYPQLVRTDDNGIKSVAYQNMVPILLQAIKEEQQQIQSLQQQFDELKKLIMTNKQIETMH